MAPKRNFLIWVLFGCYLLNYGSCQPRGWFTFIQKSAGITVIDAPTTISSSIQHMIKEVDSERLTSDSPFEATTNETDKNATKMIETVLNDVVQTSMNDMLLKLTSSLSGLFSLFSSSKHHRKQQEATVVDSGEMRDRWASATTGNVANQLLRPSSAPTSKFAQQSLSGSDEWSQNDVHLNGLNFDRQVDQQKNLNDEAWWRNIIVKVLRTNQAAFNNQLINGTLNRSNTTIQTIPVSRSVTAEPVVTKETSETRRTDYQTSHEVHEANLFTSRTVKVELQLLSTPQEETSAAFDVENETTTHTFSNEIETEQTSIEGHTTSVPPKWELLIKLDKGLEGVWINQSTVAITTTTIAPLTVSQENSPLSDALASNNAEHKELKSSVLITGDPNQTVAPTKKTIATGSHRPPANKTSSLFFQTILISGAAVFAILIFSCFSVALVSYGRRKSRRNSAVDQILPRFDPTTGVGVFGNGRPIFKTSSTCNAPYYYDSSHSDWSLMTSRDRDRQVETYFASACVLDATCESSTSPTSSTSAIPMNSAPITGSIMH